MAQAGRCFLIVGVLASVASATRCESATNLATAESLVANCEAEYPGCTGGSCLDSVVSCNDAAFFSSGFYIAGITLQSVGGVCTLCLEKSPATGLIETTTCSQVPSGGVPVVTMWVGDKTKTPNGETQYYVNVNHGGTVGLTEGCETDICDMAKDLNAVNFPCDPCMQAMQTQIKNLIGSKAADLLPSTTGG